LIATRHWQVGVLFLFLVSAFAVSALAAAPSVATAAAGTVTFTQVPDPNRLLHNPACGWVIYANSIDELNQFARVIPYASLVHIRVPWSKMEPVEGVYAWKNDPAFSAFIKEIQRRGLRISIRVYADSEDMKMQVTPLFVRQAGAGGYTGGDKSFTYWNPYFDDAVFRAKWTNFVHALAAQYDDPRFVDWIELGLGKWGEMHTLWPARGHATTDTYHGSDAAVVQWDVDLFAGSFKNVLVAAQFGSADDGVMDQALKAGTLDIMRRDSFASPEWLPANQKRHFNRNWEHGSAMMAENCYFHIEKWQDPWKPFYPDLDGLVKGYLHDAEECHANTLSINSQADADTYFRNYKNSLLIRWSRECGYQLYPASVTLPEHPVAGSKIDIIQQWCNAGAGRMPNASLRWHGKYHVAFAWIDSKNTVISATATSAEPSSWVAGQTFNCTESVAVPSTQEKSLRLAVGIVDISEKAQPSIQLALSGTRIADTWYVLGKVDLHP
jgi:hypothetical protein